MSSHNHDHSKATHQHSGAHGDSCHHHDHSDTSAKKLMGAVSINLLLSVALFIGAFISQSLSLAADSVHNLGDCGALVIAYWARRIALRPPDSNYTFGYGKAESLGSLINSSLLMITAIYLAGQAVYRFFNLEPVQGSVVMWLAGLALLIDLGTVWLLNDKSGGANMRAAMLHNLADAMSSFVVLIGGFFMMKYGWAWVDPSATLLVSAYIVWHAFPLLKHSVKVIMKAVPDNFSVAELTSAVKTISGVIDVHHVHLWALDEKQISFEAHVVVQSQSLEILETLKVSVKDLLKSFNVTHSTIEFEVDSLSCESHEHGQV